MISLNKMSNNKVSTQQLFSKIPVSSDFQNLRFLYDVDQNENYYF